MTMRLVDAANEFRDRAGDLLEKEQFAEAFRLLEMAYTAAFMERSKHPIAFSFEKPSLLPRPLADTAHVLVRLSREAIRFVGRSELAAHPLSEFRRFPMVGEMLSNIALTLPVGETFEIVLDLGDGADTGDYPRVAYSSARADAVLVPDPYLDIFENYDTLRAYIATNAKPWRDRKDVIFWRGTASGRQTGSPPLPDRLDPGVSADWHWHPRVHLCAASRNSRHAGRIDTGLVSLHQIAEPGLRSAVERAGFVAPKVAKEEFAGYRYQIDIDGWSNAWSFLDKMIMGATIFKVASPYGFRQWFYDRVVPWEHFIPVASDLSDFDERIDWAFARPEECRRIAENAAAAAQTIQLGRELAAAERAVAAALTPVTSPS